MKKAVLLVSLVVLLALSAGVFGEGELKQLLSEPRVNEDSFVKITAVFENSGNSIITARFIGKAYLNDMLVESLKSGEILVAPGTAEIPVYFKPGEPGIYFIEGWVVHNGEESNTASILLKVSPSGEVVPLGVGVSALVVVVVGLALIVFLRRKR